MISEHFEQFHENRAEPDWIPSRNHRSINILSTRLFLPCSL